MKSRSETWFALLREIGSACSVSTTQDVQYVERRVSAEGDSFYTVSLPLFEKDLIRSIREGVIPSDAFVGFQRRKIRDKETGFVYQGVPNFLGGFLDLLFTSREIVLDVETGNYHEEFVPFPSLRLQDPTELDPAVVMACKGVRQLCLLFSKEKSLCDQSKIEEAITGYVRTDESVIDPLSTSGGTSFLKEVFSPTSSGSWDWYLATRSQLSIERSSIWS
jgi:hypothetical protein